MASKGVNKVILIGNLGNEPEVRYTTTGRAMATISIATSESWKDKDSGAQQERTEWHRVVFFSRLAEIVGEYLHKGSKVFVEGSLRTRKWTDKNDQERYTTEVIASNMQMLDSKGSSGGYAQTESNFSNPASNNQTQQQAAPAGNIDEFDDEIPF